MRYGDTVVSPAGCRRRDDGAEVRVRGDQCQREAMVMYPVSLKVAPASSGSMQPPRPTGAYDPAPGMPEDTNAKDRLDMITACLHAKAGEQK